MGTPRGQKLKQKLLLTCPTQQTDSLLLVDKPLSILNTSTQRESDGATFKTGLLHVKLGSSSISSAPLLQSSQAQSA